MSAGGALVSPLRILYRIAGHLPPRVKRIVSGLREQRFLVGVIGVVTEDRGRVLLFRHTYRPFAPWGLPSGFLRAGDSVEGSIVREIAEETGLRVEFVDILRIRAHPTPRRVDVWIRCRALPGVAHPSAEVEEVRFFPFDELPSLIEEQRLFLVEHRALLE